MKWNEVKIQSQGGLINSIAPEIISASRSTDIPAFYSEWFMNRLREGYVKWVNPFNQKAQYVAFEKAKVIVFWSKNPRPLMPYLHEIDKKGLLYYFHFTLNDYENEKLEPNVPPLKDRIATFQALSDKIGKDRVIWRFDPLVLTKDLNIKGLMDKVKRVGDQIANKTTKLIFSFADISDYQKVGRNLKNAKINYIDFTKEYMTEAAIGISELCKGWGIEASTCAEAIELSQFGIKHNKCIDDDLILKISNYDNTIKKLFGIEEDLQKGLFEINSKPKKKLKDLGQRLACGCIFSKDIGMYNTCPHLCIYCYANNSESIVQKNVKSHNKKSESIISLEPSKKSIKEKAEREDGPEAE
jgi:DNA repair photolyase